MWRQHLRIFWNVTLPTQRNATPASHRMLQSGPPSVFWSADWLINFCLIDWGWRNPLLDHPSIPGWSSTCHLFPYKASAAISLISSCSYNFLQLHLLVKFHCRIGCFLTNCNRPYIVSLGIKGLSISKFCIRCLKFLLQNH